MLQIIGISLHYSDLQKKEGINPLNPTSAKTSIGKAHCNNVPLVMSSLLLLEGVFGNQPIQVEVKT